MVGSWETEVEGILVAFVSCNITSSTKSYSLVFALSLVRSGFKMLPAVVKKLGYKGITQSILVARTSVMSQNGSKCYFRSFPMLG